MEVHQRRSTAAPGPSGSGPGTNASSSSTSASSSQNRHHNHHGRHGNHHHDATENRIEGSFWSWWHSLTQKQKQTASVIALIVVYMSQNYLITIAISCIVFYYLSLRKPSTDSFKPFFESWYKVQYFPRFSKSVELHYHDRASAKAKEGKLFDALGDHAKGWFTGATKSIQAETLCSSIVNGPLVFEDRGALLSVTVNLGSSDHPCPATFFGVHEMWFLAPYLSIDFENTTILDE